MILFVQTECTPQTYLVDAGGGTIGLVRPIPVCDGAIVKGASAPEEHRVVRVRGCSDAAESPSCRESIEDWQLEMRCGTHMPEWRVLFTFSTVSVGSSAIESASRFLLGPQGDAAFQTNIFCVKYFRLGYCEHEGGESKPSSMRCEATGDLGRLVLTGNKATRRIGDKCEVVATIDSDLERRTILKDVFGVDTDNMEIREERPSCSS
ncbi:hypothetical protein SCHPADRAFT_462348 [Schizopora paradoxa]|uniref:Uncharacterized protein n=1 Tax=Schizopora paradoxa TaxID=27342 RepID=A0A0H2S3R3_9AGAM|nr:hypothetical protein SCHPADRAFT_462348 [Schizopora paradoxa]